MTKSNFITILHRHGLIGASIKFNDLPPDVQQNLQQCTTRKCTDQFINLIANVGPTFWTQLQSSEYKDNPHPVDEFAHALALKLIAASNTVDECSILYPSTQPVPLMQLGKLVGWSAPSPLGLGLHPTYGPWFAYRALVLSPQPLQTELTAVTDASMVDAPESSDENTLFGSVCANCAAPCVTACPANAVSKSSTFNIESCAGYRLQTESDCADTCHARYACPVGQQHQYSDAQTAHHMSRALMSLASWFRASEPR